MPRTPSQESSLLLSIDDLAHLLSVSKRNVWRLRSAGEMPAPLYIGRLVRWRREEIERWIAAGMPGRRESETLKGKGASR